MNRAIKLRAWDSKSQRMYYQGEPDLEDIQSFFHHYNNNDELMQFTGLYDKNGKEIYEGDVIPIFGKNHAVKFKDGMFTINDREMRRYIHSIPLEVIGNVYENPELLK